MFGSQNHRIFQELENDMWELAYTPPITEEIIGFTFPVEGIFFIVTSAGLYQIRLIPQFSTSKIKRRSQLEAYLKPTRCWLTLDNRRYQINGDDCGEIPLGEHPNGDTLDVDLGNGNENLLIMDANRERILQVIEDFAVSSGWAIAGFSADWRFLLVSDKRRVRVFGLVEKGASRI